MYEYDKKQFDDRSGSWKRGLLVTTYFAIILTGFVLAVL